MARWIQRKNPDGTSRFVPMDRKAAEIDGVDFEEVQAQEQQHFIQGDMEQFRSPIDGSMIRDRKQYREHCKKHGVVPAAEFDAGFYEEHRKRREAPPSKQEIHAIGQEMYDLACHAERGGQLNTRWRERTLDE